MGNVIDVKYLQDVFKDAITNQYISQYQRNNMSYYIDDLSSFKNLILDTMHEYDVFDDTYTQIDSVNRCLTYYGREEEIDIDMCAWDTFFHGDDETYMAGCEYNYQDYMIPNMFYGSETNRVLDESSVQSNWHDVFSIICTSPESIYFTDDSGELSKFSLSVTMSESIFDGGLFTFNIDSSDGDNLIPPYMWLTLNDVTEFDDYSFSPGISFNVSASTGLTTNSTLEIEGNSFEVTSVRTGSTGISSCPVYSHCQIDSSGIACTINDIKLWSSVVLYPEWEASAPQFTGVTWTLNHPYAYVELGTYSPKLSGATHTVQTYRNCPIFADNWNLVGYGQVTGYTNTSVTFKLTADQVANMQSNMGTTSSIGWIYIGIPFIYSGYTRLIYLNVYIPDWNTFTNTQQIGECYIDIGDSSSQEFTIEDWRTEGGYIWVPRTYEYNDDEMHDYPLEPGETYGTRYFTHKFVIELEYYDGCSMEYDLYSYNGGYWTYIYGPYYDDSSNEINFLREANNPSTIANAFRWLSNTFKNRIKIDSDYI